MTEKRYKLSEPNGAYLIDGDRPCAHWINDDDKIVELLNGLADENEQLKAQLYCDDEEGVCNICKHHYLVKDDETELGYYNSGCEKGHDECARVSLKHCEDFEKELKE